MCCDNNLSLQRFLHKLRIYWAQSLAHDWILRYHKRLEKVNSHKAITRGLLALLPKLETLEILNKYAPIEAKINWDEIDDISLSYTRHIAKSMHIARPQPTPDVILLYAKGDYLQYALPSLIAIFYNLRLTQSLVYIPKLLDSPVSLQKHGVRFAFNKMKTEELTKMFSNFWMSSKNLSIRAVIFKLSHANLNKETNEVRINDMWHLLDFLMDNITTEEDKSIYDTLSKVEKLPISVRGKFLKKSYNFLKRLIETNDKKYEDYEKSIQMLVRHTEEIMDSVDPDFIVDILMEFIRTNFLQGQTKDWMTDIISKYLFLAKHEESQKLKMLIEPLMESLLESWSSKSFLKDNFDGLVSKLQSGIYDQVNHRRIPIKVLSYILAELENLPIQENYVLLRKLKLIETMANIYDNLFKTELRDNLNISQKEIDIKSASEFGKKCYQFLKEDVKLYFPCIYVLFSKALEALYNRFPEEAKAITCKCLLEDEQFIEGHLCAITLFPTYCNCEHRRTSKEVHDILKSHPSVEVRMHYYNRYNNTSYGMMGGLRDCNKCHK